MRILDHLRPIESTDLDAFITRLDDTADRVRENLRVFVVSDKLRDDLDAMLSAIGERLADNRDVGRFIYGSFGSGKSHLMTVLGKMLERDEAVYDLGHAHLRELRASNPWLDERKVLVVRLNMMGQRNLTTALYEAYNDALPDDVEPLSFTDEARVFELIDKDAERLGGLDALLERIAADGAIPSAKFYHRMRDGTLTQRLSLAAKLQQWRDHGARAVRPDDLWVDAREGFDRIARHAQSHGYGAIAWLIDELVIWIREKDRATYIKQINDLSAMVDHDAARVLPFFVAVAVQMDIAETCPEDISEQGFREQLGFISNRFQPSLYLEEQDLVEVASQRVLARSDTIDSDTRASFERAIDTALDKNRDMVSTLAGGLDHDQIRKLYPFHPALLRVLVDVTQALSRQRTAVAALYGLLRAYPDLEVGKFVPVGALWEILFTANQLQALRQQRRSVLAQKLADTAETYHRLEGKIASVAVDQKAEPKELAQLVRTALMCQLSERPYYPDGRALRESLTASTLLCLNQADVRTSHPRLGRSKVVKLLRTLGGAAPQVQIIGKDEDPKVHIKTEQVDIERVLAMARAEVGHTQRFAFMRQLLVEQLGLKLGTTHEGPVDVTWKGTRRRGTVRVVNVRTMSYAGKLNEFDPGKGEFLLLVDYPFDEEPGRTRQDDIDTLERARGRQTHWTLAWLPEHLSPTEMDALQNATAVEIIRKDPRRFLADFSPTEAGHVKTALEGYLAGRRSELEAAVRRLYFDQGEVRAMKTALDGFSLQGIDQGRAVEKLGEHVLDKRYPAHPDFRRRVGVHDLAQVADWVVRAAKTGQPVDLTQSQMHTVDAFAVPLELVYKGASSISPRLDGRYLRAIMEWTRSREAFDARELRALLMAEDGWQFGLSEEVANFFLFYLLVVEGYEAIGSGRSLTIDRLARMPDSFKLVKDEVVEPATWDAALRAARELLSLKPPSDLPTSPAQAKLSRSIAEHAKPLRAELDTFLHQLRQTTQTFEFDLAGSTRIKEATDLKATLEDLLADQSNAGRVRRLAELDGDKRLSTWAALSSRLASETTALTKIEDMRSLYQAVVNQGTPEDRDAVVPKLRTLLTDGVAAGDIGTRVGGLKRETEARFKRVMSEKKVKKAKLVGEVKSTGVPRAQLTSEIEKVVMKLLEKATDDETFDVYIALERADS